MALWSAAGLSLPTTGAAPARRRETPAGRLTHGYRAGMRRSSTGRPDADGHLASPMTAVRALTTGVSLTADIYY